MLKRRVLLPVYRVGSTRFSGVKYFKNQKMNRIRKNSDYTKINRRSVPTYTYPNGNTD